MCSLASVFFSFWFLAIFSKDLPKNFLIWSFFYLRALAAT
jgi:hypothetical protein